MTDQPPFIGRSSVEVNVDDKWRAGRLRSCDHLDDQGWTCLVTWFPDEGHVRTDRFPAERVR
ncbi:MAG: hypothetical protein ACRDO2_06640 [Nocardioidaceae bacterium]